MPILVVETFEEWRAAARRQLARGVPPSDVQFRTDASRQPLLSLSFEEPESEDPDDAVARETPLNVPRDFLELARVVACHRDPGRWELLYRVLWRLTHGERNLLDLVTDDDVLRLTGLEKNVSRDAHKAKAFVRFRRVMLPGDDPDQPPAERYIAWHRPDHHILRLVAPFFSRRFPEMNWSILTPDESVHWNRQTLEYGSGVPASEAPTDDALEELWTTYYGAIFNPARIKLKMMTREMPVRHWKTLPETRAIPDLLADAPRRLAAMAKQAERDVESAVPFLPAERDLTSLAAAAAVCRGCDLHRRATQTVFGRGPATARLVLVGEQPGDQEDLAGEPFIGPAGEVLDRALRDAGISRDDVYLTNAVKHFHWEENGKHRLHKKPPARAMSACAPWLHAELAALRPAVIVCLGATAAQVVVGRDSKLTRDRGVFQPSAFCSRTLMTWHPSAILRMADVELSRARMEELISDLTTAARAAFDPP